MATKELYEAPEMAEAEEDTARRSDEELLAMGHILRKLNTLEDDAARSRVMEYLHDRFSSSPRRARIMARLDKDD